jgi:hypothetical protein
LNFEVNAIAFVKDIAGLCYNIPVSKNALTGVFDGPRSQVQAALTYRLDDPGQQGQPIVLDQDHEQQIFDWIQQNARKDTQTKRGEIMDYCTSQAQIKFTR